jgi:hypothetical protein
MDDNSSCSLATLSLPSNCPTSGSVMKRGDATARGEVLVGESALDRTAIEVDFASRHAAVRLDPPVV